MSRAQSDRVKCRQLILPAATARQPGYIDDAMTARYSKTVHRTIGKYKTAGRSRPAPCPNRLPQRIWCVNATSRRLDRSAVSVSAAIAADVAARRTRPAPPPACADRWLRAADRNRKASPRGAMIRQPFGKSSPLPPVGWRPDCFGVEIIDARACGAHPGYRASSASAPACSAPRPPRCDGRLRCPPQFIFLDKDRYFASACSVGLLWYAVVDADGDRRRL